MSIQRAEQLKRELTDKYVVVADGVAELRRFGGFTGRVKTVNMSGRALVQFDGPADIGWYDIDPAYLTVVAAPVQKAAKAEGHAAPAAAAAKPAAPAAKAPGKSPLEMARAQGAAKSGATPAPSAPPAPATPSAAAAPQPVAAAVKAAAAPSPPPAAPSAAPKEKVDTSKLSTAEILALARQQGAVKN